MANEQGHAFIHHTPPSHVIRHLRNCGMHADHNFAKRILVFLVMIAVQIDVANGIAKSVDKPSSKVNHILNMLSEKPLLVQIVKRIKEAVQKQGSNISAQHFPWRLKGPNLSELCNIMGGMFGYLSTSNLPNSKEFNANIEFVLGNVMMIFKTFCKLSILHNKSTSLKQSC